MTTPLGTRRIRHAGAMRYALPLIHLLNYSATGFDARGANGEGME
jgi:hypothetical protein